MNKTSHSNYLHYFMYHIPKEVAMLVLLSPSLTLQTTLPLPGATNTTTTTPGSSNTITMTEAAQPTNETVGSDVGDGAGEGAGGSNQNGEGAKKQVLGEL